MTTAAWAAFSSFEELLLAPRSAGAGGVGVANPGIDGTLFSNPAGLALVKKFSIATLGGSMPGRKAGMYGVLATLPVDGSLSFGIGYNALNDWEFSQYTEDTYSGAVTLSFGPFFTAGGRVMIHQLRSEGLGESISGNGVDLGVLSRLGKLPFVPGEFSMGGAIENTVADWPDRNFRRSVPVMSKAGLAWNHGRWEAGLERHWVHADSLPDDGYQAWRAGLQAELPWQSEVRVGFVNEPVTRFTAGASKSFESSGVRLDYAYLQNFSPVNISHRIGVSMEFGKKEKEKETMSITPLQLLMEPGSKRIKMARLALAINSNEEVEAWTLEIRNKKGEIIRTLRGEGRPPADLAWDGQDDMGNAVAADDVYYQLAIKTPDGIKRGQVLALVNAGGFDISSIAIASFENAADGPRLVPILSGPDGGGLSRLSIDFSGVNAENVAVWKVIIRDEDGKIVKVYQGEGPIPENLVWDGTDQDGNRIKKPLGLRLEFSYTDSAGESFESAVPVFTQETYEKAVVELRSRPSLKLIEFQYGNAKKTVGDFRIFVPSGRALATVNLNPRKKRFKSVPIEEEIDKR